MELAQERLKEDDLVRGRAVEGREMSRPVAKKENGQRSVDVVACERKRRVLSKVQEQEKALGWGREKVLRENPAKEPQEESGLRVEPGRLNPAVNVEGHNEKEKTLANARMLLALSESNSGSNVSKQSMRPC